MGNLLLVFLTFFLPWNQATGQLKTTRLSYAPAPADNPLKGLVPYNGAGGKMPHSLEFWNFPMRDLMKGPADFDWGSVEKKLESARQRGNQMVLRVYLEMPGKSTGVPQYLLNDGLHLEKYFHKKQVNWTPKYDDPRMIDAMTKFITAFGKRYNGDSRIGFLTMGIIGHWGEWHTFPRADLFPTKKTQQIVMQTFQKSFPDTKVLMRYPAGDNDWQKRKKTLIFHLAITTIPFAGPPCTPASRMTGGFI